MNNLKRKLQSATKVNKKTANIPKESTNANDEVVSAFFSKQNCDSEILIEEKISYDNKETLNNMLLSKSDVASKFLKCASELSAALKAMPITSPAEYIYNPTEYAIEPFTKFVQTYGNSDKIILFIGMNPGPFGMSQTGVPFGEINAVRDWLKITGFVGKPPKEAPQRPVLGFECQRSEVSGKRFWQLAKDLSGTPEKFFKDTFIYNYCPLQFIGIKGKNVTPDELKKEERENLYKICDQSLLNTIHLFNSKILIGIGKFAETRVNKILKEHCIKDIKVYCITHPSPRVANNSNWQNKAVGQLDDLKLLPYFTN